MKERTIVTKSSEPFVYSLVRQQSSLACIPLPETFIEESDNLYAYATGRFDEHGNIISLLVISSLCLKALTTEELEALIAHELAHIQHKDFVIGKTRNLNLMHFGAFLFVSCTVLSAILWDFLFAVGMLSLFIFILVHYQILTYPCRKKEKRADLQGAINCKNPTAMISMLEKTYILTGYQYHMIIPLLDFFKINTHPKLKERVANIKRELVKEDNQ